MNKKASVQLGPLTVHSAESDVSRMAILLWGPSGAGKTTFAATAPGKKLWLSMGDNEHVSVLHRKDVQFVKLYELELNDLIKHGKSDNPFGLDAFLRDNTDIETVVFDSLTALAFRALQSAIDQGIGAGGTFRPSIETPGISAYGARNAICLATLTGLLRVTAKHDCHIIVTAHEDDPTTQKSGKDDVIDHIGIMLGGKIVNNVTWRLSEIWYMSQKDTGDKSRRLAIRPTRLRRPMKTRMFVDNAAPEFDLSYDAAKPDNAKGQMTIAAWYEEWVKGKGAKLEIPK